MQIGNADLDQVCEDAIVPAIEGNDLEARRVDKHNAGGLLKSEIIEFLQNADIIVADLTNERPNCYLEIGYAMGIDKFRNLILTAREDHYPESPNFVKGGPKIHFDLIGYDILFWEPGNLDAFRDELSKRIKRRRLIIAPPQKAVAEIFDTDWITSQKELATPGFEEFLGTGYMEVHAALHPPKTNATQLVLSDAARESMIHTFGWPIGVCLENTDNRPKPRADGIFAEIRGDDHFDYWAWRKNGDFYLLKSIFEDQRDPKKIFFNTRIIRVTETLLYLARQFNRLGVEPDHRLVVKISHGGFQGRTLGASNPNRIIREYAPAQANLIESEVHITVGEIEVRLVELVKELVAPLFLMFDFFELNDGLYEQIVNDFVNGKCT